MSDISSVADELIEHCLGAGCPTQALLNTGVFPPGWVARYVELIERAKAEHGDEPMWPRELAAAAYVASVYCPKRYRDWQQLGGTANQETEHALGEIRRCGDELLLGWFPHGADQSA